MNGSTGTGWLLAPMELSALVVGQNAGAKGLVWSDLTPGYQDIWSNLVTAGPQLVDMFPQGGSAAPPDGGVHLHWLLPQAFGHGVPSKEHGGLDYPHIPNRWLVRRIRYKRGTDEHPESNEVKDTASWIIQSDFLHEMNQDKVASGAVPFLNENSDKLFASVGQATPLQDWTDAPANYRLELKALGSGTADFPSSYPLCKSVLGFHDPDPACGAEGDWDVSYVVSGWCSDATKDLLYGVTEDDLAKRLAELEFKISETGAKLGLMNRVLCHGAATRVKWNVDHLHVPLSEVPCSDATVFVGNTSGEALATMLAPKMHVDGATSADLERILTAFHYDMLGSDQNLQDVDAELHRRRFTDQASEDRFSIDAKRTVIPDQGVSASAPMTAEPPRPVQVLPKKTATDLRALNTQAKAHARAQRNLARTRQTLFTAWMRWATNYNHKVASDPDLAEAVAAARKAVGVAAKAADDVRTAVDAQETALKTQLKNTLPDLELSRSTGTPFHHPADPAILVTGKNFEARNVYNQYLQVNELLCRHAGEVIDGIEGVPPSVASAVEVSTRFLFPLDDLTPLPPLAGAPYADLLNGVLRETLLLDVVDPRARDAMPPIVSAIAKRMFALSNIQNPSDAGVNALSTGIMRLLEGGDRLPNPDLKLRFAALTDTAPAIVPDSLGLRRWTGNPWRPLYLVWEVDWNPQAGLGGDAPIPGNWSSWELNDSGNDFEIPKDLAVEATPYTYKSYTMLAPNAAFVLRRRLEKLVETKANDKLSQIISDLDSMPVVAQSLGGFQEALGQLMQGLQLPPINPEYLNANLPSTLPKLDPVADRIDGFEALDPQNMYAPALDRDGTPLHPFQPMRAGKMTIRQLSVVDSFGQTRVLIDPTRATARVVPSFGLPTPEDDTPGVVLPPRYLQPARINFEWRSAEDDDPVGTPLCGWIFSNHLDQSLMICDAKGTLLGALQRIIRAAGAGGSGQMREQSNTGFFWVPVPGTDTTAEAIENMELHRFVKRVLGFNGDEARDFLTSIAAAQAEADITVEHDPRLSILVGRPLALVRSLLGIELNGDPYRDVAGTDDAATRDIAAVQFPTRLGGSSDTAGGLSGFMLEDDDTYYPRFGLSGQSFDGFQYGKEIPLDAKTSVPVTLLMDPHAAVHVRSGILPRRSLNLPEDVTAGLSSIRDVFFQSAPILGPPGAPRLPNPSDDYGNWSWAARPQVTRWLEYPEITDPGDRGGFGTDPQQLQEGWLKLKMNPVAVSAFWVKEGAVTVRPGTNITLGWMSDGADKLVLKASNQPDSLDEFTTQDGATLPTEFKYTVTEKVTITLTASDRQGNRSIKSLDLDVGKET
ncbi:hypothetical protein [Tateyamaria pelophila]|uniref:hypothetical protein n=1 Tax=Tateyamaria pelophila TaxID=328415 RepID=UPI001CBA9179|nr:hypothetical protein [Tateyamaria pelophila]